LSRRERGRTCPKESGRGTFHLHGKEKRTVPAGSFRRGMRVCRVVKEKKKEGLSRSRARKNEKKKGVMGRTAGRRADWSSKDERSIGEDATAPQPWVKPSEGSLHRTEREGEGSPDGDEGGISGRGRGEKELSLQRLRVRNRRRHRQRKPRNKTPPCLWHHEGDYCD